VEKRSSSTPVAFSEKSEKLTPSGDGVAPRGCGEPFSTIQEVGGLVVVIMVQAANAPPV
jgi:hypothetical protein